MTFLNFVPAAEAAPSSLEKVNGAVIWKIGQTRIWRFPQAHAANAKVIADRFDRLYAKGFKITDLHVSKVKDQWSLCIGKEVVLSPLKEYGGTPQTVAVHCLSNIYEAVARMHASPLTAKHKLKGGYKITSKVSWYGGKFVGRKFASGERYTATHLVAAAKNLPYGTVVKITATATGKSVIVRVADRFGEHKGRALDVTQAAAEILNIKRMGVAGAKIEVLGTVKHIGGR